jgi:hypothetical protein
VRLMLLLIGCPTPEGFTNRFVAVDCDQLETCDPADYAMLFVGRDETCEAVLEPEQDRLSACLRRSCSFDHAAARDCLDDMESATCDEFLAGDAFDACSRVWSDCDGHEQACF